MIAELSLGAVAGVGGVYGAQALRQAYVEFMRRAAKKYCEPLPVAPKQKETTVDEVAAAIVGKLHPSLNDVSVRVKAIEVEMARYTKDLERWLAEAKQEAPVRLASCTKTSYDWKKDPEVFALAKDLNSALVNFGAGTHKQVEAQVIATMEAIARPGVTFDELFRKATKK